MYALFVVVNQLERFESLVRQFQQAELRGGTIFDSQGMAAVMNTWSSEMLASTIRGMLNKGRPYSRTVMMVLDEDELYRAKAAVEAVMGDIDDENAGIMLAFPLSHLWGLGERNLDPRAGEGPAGEEEGRD